MSDSQLNTELIQIFDFVMNFDFLQKMEQAKV